MPAWTSDELKTIETTEELEIAGLRKDGTLHSYRTIWVVRVGDRNGVGGDLYVRSVNGRGSAWFRGVLTRHEGRIQSGGGADYGVTKDVTFEESFDARIHEQIDAAYRKKYSHYPKAYVDACVTPQARAATIKLIPRQ